jgi:hypothetical protein
MPNVKFIGAEHLPSAFCDHVIVEPVSGGYQSGGICLVGRRVQRLSAPLRSTFEEAFTDAKAWCEKYDLPEVLVVAEPGDQNTQS